MEFFKWIFLEEFPLRILCLTTISNRLLVLQRGPEIAGCAARNRNGNSPHQGLRIFLGRILEHLPPGSIFNELAAAHHGDIVAHAFDHGHIVRDEEIGDAHLLLQLEKQVQHLTADRHVER